MNPFAALMMFVGGICMIPVMYKLKLNMIERGHFDDPSFQAGMIWACVLLLIGIGLAGLLAWFVV